MAASVLAIHAAVCLAQHGWRVACDSCFAWRARLTQGKPGIDRLGRGFALILLGLFNLPATARASCDGPPLHFQPLAQDLWLVAAGPGDANTFNRGHVSNLLVALDGPRTWLLGSGPSPVFGKALVCHVRTRFGRVVTDVISPWPRPELVLGLRAMPRARAWAHIAVARAMQERCLSCVERLRERLGQAASDLGEEPIVVPDRIFAGSQGRLGPWEWRLLARGQDYPVTIWRHLSSDVQAAHGLLWGDGAPDGRDADLATLAASTHMLQGSAPSTIWVGEQGSPLRAAAVDEHVRYWQALLEAAQRSVDAGDDGTQPAPDLPGLAILSASPRHALNWQRAWRQTETRWLQRSLR